MGINNKLLLHTCDFEKLCGREPGRNAWRDDERAYLHLLKCFFGTNPSLISTSFRDSIYMFAMLWLRFNLPFRRRRLRKQNGEEELVEMGDVTATSPQYIAFIGSGDFPLRNWAKVCRQEQDPLRKKGPVFRNVSTNISPFSRLAFNDV